MKEVSYVPWGGNKYNWPALDSSNAETSKESNTTAWSESERSEKHQQEDAVYPMACTSMGGKPQSAVQVKTKERIILLKQKVRRAGKHDQSEDLVVMKLGD